MPDDENPPLRRFVLKPKEVAHTDPPARPGDGTAISVQLMHRQNEIAAQRGSLGKSDDSSLSPPDLGTGEPPVSPLLMAREITPTEAPSRPGDGTAISVDLIHEQNRIADEKRGPEIVAMPARRRSRRTRDFIMLMAAASGVDLIFMLMLPRTIGTLTMGLVGLAFVAAMLGWIMFGVMDDY
jgi:hypothetical protein